VIDYQFFELKNGLKVYVHPDPSTTLAVVNICYNVGSRDEHENKTGFAHLFEHLMFGGSQNIPSFDTPLQNIGAQNNAFTSPDLTNYYVTLPAVNLETAFWLESDRMLALSFDPKVLEVQQKVVIEEFKQRYLNQPYGDVWLKLRPLAYQKHPYRWATIGKNIEHIQQATMDDVRQFFYQNYLPNNAVMVVAGNVNIVEVEKLAQKWFGPIPTGKQPKRHRPTEPPQTQPRSEHTTTNVPLSAIYKAYHMPGRYHEQYASADLLSDVLGRGQSARLHRKLVKEKPIFNNISAYVMGSLDPGLFVVSGHVNKGVSVSDADKYINDLIAELQTQGVSDQEYEKVKNQAETTLAFAEVDLLNRAMALAFAANAGNVNYANMELEKLQNVSKAAIITQAKNILSPNNCSTLYYLSA
jgi:zinc protease